ncbi:MAG: LysM peptidoglycan-binding domain-containing protein [Anaerolineae bacterium]|nr:LysM peptidoglycan-binding domain-containing protein [Anaerolineae bacterium]
MKLKQKFLPFIFLFLLSALLIPIIASARVSKPATDAYSLIAEVNALRTANGLAPYAISATLMSVAQAHSDYQAATSSVTHYSADGSRPFQRALAAGYPVSGDLTLGGFFSENIVAGNGLTVTRAVEIWQGDAPHLNTMLSSHLTEVGAGVTNVNGYIYYTLDASAPSDGAVPVYTPDPNLTPDSMGATGALPTLDLIMPVITSTPSQNGKVIHEVQVGQSVWGIADVYGTTVQEIRALNNMSADELVYPGELLFIRTVATETLPTPTLAATSTTPPTQVLLTETSLPTSVPTLIVEEMPAEEQSEKNILDSGLWVVLVIIFAALLMAGLVTWLSGRDGG